MADNLQIAFDFNNSKEYFLKYFPEEYIENDKKFYIFKKKLEENNIGTFLIEFLNLDFDDPIHLNYFLVHYFFPNFIFTYKNPLYFEYYKNRELTFEELDNLQLILSEDEIINFSNEAKLLYAISIESAQYVFRNIADNVYFKTLFESSTPKDSDYEKLKSFKDIETYDLVLNDISENFKDIKINFDINNFFLEDKPEKVNDIKYFYSSSDFACILYICLKEFVNNKKSFRLLKCKNCDFYFIPKTGHKTLYCDEIFEDDKTCKEYANSIGKNFANDPVYKKYRNRYKNISKEASYSNNPAVAELYESYKKDGAKYLQDYKLGNVSAEDFIKWIDSMKIRK